jgi:hypothetical protein
MPDSPLGTPDEVAAYMRTTVPALSQLRYRGQGPKFIRSGRKILYRWEAVEEYLQQNTLQRTDDKPVSA